MDKRPHARHAILDVPGLEIGVPVELLALEAGLVVEPRLMDVDVVAEQEPRHAGQPRVGGQAPDHAALVVDLEDRADFAGDPVR